MADSKVVFETELDTTGLVQGLKQLDSSGLSDLTLGASSEQLTRLGTKLGNIIGTSTALAIAKAIGSTGIAFDTAMSQVAATMGTTVDSIQSLSELAEISGRTTKFTAVEAAEALNYMALAGWDVTEIMTGFPEVLELAAAGNLDLAYASDIVTDGLTAMGLMANDAGALVDQMAKTASSSNTSVKQLGQGILAVGATARTLAGGTTELNTALGLLADNGIKASKGGRQLRNIITALGSPIGKAQEAFDALSVSAYDADGNFRPLSDTFGDLRIALDGLSDQERLQYIDAIFNKEDFASVNALLGTTVERWNELNGAIAASEGAAGQMAATQLDNLGGDLTLFKSAVEGLKLAVYDPFEPLVRGYAQGATNAINTATDVLVEGIAVGAEVAKDQVEVSWSDLWNAFTAPDAKSGGAGKSFAESQSWWSQLFPSAGAEELGTYSANAAGTIQEQLNAELRKAFADGDPQVQAALMNSLTPAEGMTPTMGAETIQQLADKIGDELAAGLETQHEKVSEALTSMVESITESFTEIQTTGDALGESEWLPVIDISEAASAALDDIALVQKAGDELGASKWTPLIDANDQASGVIESIRAALASLDGTSATVHINASGEIPGHADGLSYVPYDNYLAYLHKGEMVLTAKEAEALRKLSSGSFASSLASRTVSGGTLTAAAAGETVVHQTNNFNVPVQTPDEFAQMLKLYATYGLEADY